MKLSGGAVLSKNAMTFVACVCFLLSLYVLRSNSNVNSDSLFFDAFVQDVFYGPGDWRDWKLTVAPSFFPDMALSWVAFLLFETPAAKIFFVSAVEATLLVHAIWLLLCCVLKFKAKDALLFSLSLVSFLNLVAAKSEMWLYFNATNCHFSVIILSVWILYCIQKIKINSNVLLYALIFSFAFVGEISTAVLFLDFSIPFFVVTLLMVIRKWWTKSSVKVAPFVLSSLLIYLAHVAVGLVQHKFLSSSLYLDSRVEIKMDRILFSLGEFKKAFFYVFELNNLYTFSTSIVIMSALIFATFLFFSRKNHLVFSKEKVYSDDDILLVFGMLALAISVLGTLLSGGFVDIWGFRYYELAFLVIVLSVVGYFQKSAHFLYVFKAFLWVVFVLLARASIKDFMVTHGEILPANVLEKRRTVALHLSQCLAQFEKDHPGQLKSGIGDYWSARGVTYLSKPHYPMIQLLHNFEFFNWMGTKGPLVHPERYPEYDLNFAIMGKNFAGQFQFTLENVGRFLPLPVGKFECMSGDYEVWHYQDDALKKFIHTRVNKNIP